jgi:hypothetical protein
MTIENIIIVALLSLSMLLLAIFLGTIQCIVSVCSKPQLLQCRYRLFSLRDELRRLYISAQHPQTEGVKFCDSDFEEIQSRINNAINVLPLLSRRFVYLYMEGPEMKRLIKEKEATRKQILTKYMNTPIGEPLQQIDNRLGDILFRAFCLNSPIYVSLRRCLPGYMQWRESLPVSQSTPIVAVSDATFSRLLANWSKVPA